MRHAVPHLRNLPLDGTAVGVPHAVPDVVLPGQALRLPFFVGPDGPQHHRPVARRGRGLQQREGVGDAVQPHVLRRQDGDVPRVGVGGEGDAGGRVCRRAGRRGVRGGSGGVCGGRGWSRGGVSVRDVLRLRISAGVWVTGEAGGRRGCLTRSRAWTGTGTRTGTGTGTRVPDGVGRQGWARVGGRVSAVHNDFGERPVRFGGKRPAHRLPDPQPLHPQRGTPGHAGLRPLRPRRRLGLEVHPEVRGPAAQVGGQAPAGGVLPPPARRRVVVHVVPGRLPHVHRPAVVQERAEGDVHVVLPRPEPRDPEAEPRGGAVRGRVQAPAVVVQQRAEGGQRPGPRGAVPGAGGAR